MVSAIRAAPCLKRQVRQSILYAHIRAWSASKLKVRGARREGKHLTILPLPLLGERHPQSGLPTALLWQMDAAQAAREAGKRISKGAALVYLDPPFCTGKSFYYKGKLGDRGYAGQGGGAQTRLRSLAYVDMPLTQLPAYLSHMRQVVIACKELLSDTGLLFLHVDARACAHLRLLLDELFGHRQFVNEIIWHYKTGGRATNHFSRKHDNILVYAKGPGYRLHMDAVGQPRGEGKRNHMKREVDEEGNVRFTIRTGGKLYTYDQESLIYPSDVWSDIPHLQQRDPQRTGYDTQKPEALLARILAVASQPGEWVADFFAGSGTTAAVAVRMGRNFVGSDVSTPALSAGRLRLLGVSNLELLHAEDNRELCAGYRLRLGWRRRGEKLQVCLQHYTLEGATPPLPLPVQLTVDQAGAWQLLHCGDLLEVQPTTICTDIQAASCIALGVIEDNTFLEKDFQFRSADAPILNPLLAMDWPREGQCPAFLLADAAGNTRLFGLNENF